MIIVLGTVDVNSFKVSNSDLRNISSRAFLLEKGKKYSILVNANYSFEGKSAGNISFIYNENGQIFKIPVKFTPMSTDMPIWVLMKLQHSSGIKLQETPGIERISV